MLASESAPVLSLAVRAAAPLAWRNDARIARKLAGFAATEAGSALDMLRAAELDPDPKLRRLFFQHAVDEARHARLFQQAARARGGEIVLDAYEAVHARRQNLYERLGRVEFVAFCARAEKKGQQHFAALARHFANDPALHRLFERVEKDERFHVRYTEKILSQWEAEGDGALVRRARVAVRTREAWQAWRRAGRRLGDGLAKGVLAAFWLVVLPAFVVLQRTLDPARTGWVAREKKPLSLDDMSSQF